ncbi:uncharacterized protein FIBRA_02912 [Fibroporia radiculosa]|uniref:FAD-binding PCMH-type domain-containing protein n=1 Tax=Fibroporia radiculosa TaxID=599839 RepID=J4I9B4_9APHY|nr:uncharacterized protein FIBRA_02912 [Fibroporia radiculosa]CCM00866.1 predicted protein [Fibroporia radiculosa]
MLLIATLTLISALSAGHLVNANSSSVIFVCERIADTISSASSVYYPSSPNYEADIYHYANSSTQNSVCSVEPGTPEDVGVILQILGASRTPFAVKGGGHIMNPGYSSTPGVQIAMTRFNDVDYDASTGTVAIGAGLVWDDVYAALEDFDVNVVGGRVSGIGVAGLTLGGGYSWLTNQYGLTLDNVQAYQLVLPNSSVINVTEASNPDLFFGLKGGYNNFGIVTTFTLKTFPQGQVWGGQLVILGQYIDQVNLATANFAANVTDPKAALITTIDYTGGQILASVIMFYDAPTPPSGIFDDFLTIPNVEEDVSTRSYLSLVQVESTQTSANKRGYYNTVSLRDITYSIMQAVTNQAEYWGAKMLSAGEAIISYDVEPFLQTILTHGSPSAYPSTRSQRYLPLNLYFSWTNSSADEAFYDAILESATNLTETAVIEGQADVATAPLYPNYAIYGTSTGRIYGASLGTLTVLKAIYDPENVMGLAGGWKV